MIVIYKSLVISLVGALALSGCGGAPPPGSTIDEIDARTPMPAADPAFVDFEGGEWVVKPGEDKLFCTHIRYDGEDIAFSDAQQLQAKYGHHAILLAAKDPKPPGTSVDCTDAASMKDYDAYALPQELPPGYGVFLPKGKAMVLQSHYLNAGLKAMRVRDVVRFKKMPIADVKTWAGMYVTNHSAFAVKVGEKKTLTFDCVMNKDIDLLLVGGHMHEWGKSFDFSVGTDVNNLKSIYLVDPWKGEFRDSPPVTLLYNQPIKLTKGMITRTTCVWENDTKDPLGFPHEMCSAFGYAGGTKDAEICWIKE